MPAPHGWQREDPEALPPSLVPIENCDLSPLESGAFGTIFCGPPEVCVGMARP